MEIILYSTSGCHLCDVARALVFPLFTRNNVTLRTVDIADSDDLLSRYATRIPVLVSPDGRELGWPFTAAQAGQFIFTDHMPRT